MDMGFGDRGWILWGISTSNAQLLATITFWLTLVAFDLSGPGAMVRIRIQLFRQNDLLAYQAACSHLGLRHTASLSRRFHYMGLATPQSRINWFSR
jgi:hypothetical protein